jgi:hypothetical protein
MCLQLQATALDRCGGGFTIVLHCSGASIPSDIENMSPTDVVVDAYIPPNETHNVHAQRHVAHLAQLFGERISLSHLQRLHMQSKALDITIPSSPCPSHPESQTDHLTLIPSPVVTGSAHFKLPCHPWNVLNRYLSALEDVDLDVSDPFDWTPGREASALLDMSTSTPLVVHPFAAHEQFPSVPSSPALGTRQRGKHLLTRNLSSASMVPLVSIGKKSDAVIDQFGLNDHLLPRLHEMTTLHRSSRWVTLLQSEDWGLEYKVARALADALMLDLSFRTKANMKASISSRRSCCATELELSFRKLMLRLVS